MINFIKNLIEFYKVCKDMDDRFKYGYEGEMHQGVIEDIEKKD